MVLYARIFRRINTASYCDNTVVGYNEKGGLHMYVQWQGKLIVETKQLEMPVTVLTNVNRGQQVCDVGLQTV
jgi:hypothetical protein